MPKNIPRTGKRLRPKTAPDESLLLDFYCGRTLFVPDLVRFHEALDCAMRARKASRGLP